MAPSSGYLLRQRFEGSVGSFWSATQSQIYRELHALEADGMVAVKLKKGSGKPDRKEYSLTKAGRQRLDAWLREPLDPIQLRHPLLLKFVFAAEVPPSELDRVLAEYDRRLQATLGEYRARLGAEEIFSLARSKREATLWRLSIEHGIGWCEHESAWIRRARRELKAKG